MSVKRGHWPPNIGGRAEGAVTAGLMAPMSPMSMAVAARCGGPVVVAAAEGPVEAVGALHLARAFSISRVLGRNPAGDALGPAAFDGEASIAQRLCPAYTDNQTLHMMQWRKACVGCPCWWCLWWASCLSLA